MTKTDIVFVTTADLSSINGPSIHVLNLVNALSASELEIVLIAPTTTSPLALPLSPAVRLDSIPNFRRCGIPGSLANLLTLRKLWRHRKAGVIYVRAAPFSLAATEFARRISVGHVAVEINGWLADEAAIRGGIIGRNASYLLNWSQLRELRIADSVRVVTPSLRSLAIAGGADPDKVHVIATGTRLDVFGPYDRQKCREELGLCSSRRLAVFVGNLWPAIDLSTAIEALKILSLNGLPVDLIVVGDGPVRAKAERNSHALKAVGIEVTFTGALPQEKAAIYLGAADIALAPFLRARNEKIGLSPLKIRDYAAAGRVIVSSDLPGLTEFQCEPWFYAAAPESAADMARAIEAALATDRPAAEARARAFAEAHFGWGDVAATIRRMLKI